MGGVLGFYGLGAGTDAQTSEYYSMIGAGLGLLFCFLFIIIYRKARGDKIAESLVLEKIPFEER